MPIPPTPDPTITPILSFDILFLIKLDCSIAWSAAKIANAEKRSSLFNSFLSKKSSNAISPEAEKLITKAEKNLEINESEKKDAPLILTNVYEIADKPKKDKASKILETQNDPKTEGQITKLDNKLSSSKRHKTLKKKKMAI